MEEIWELVDKDGRKNGIEITRDKMNTIPEGSFHLGVEVWVRVEDRILITRRHPNKAFGLMYDVPGGGVLKGESLADGAIRELYEEVGIVASPDELVPLGEAVFNKCYAASYLLVLTRLPTLRLQPCEVVGYKLLTNDEITFMSGEITKDTYQRYLCYKDKIFL